MNNKIILAGGSGYIGTSISIALIEEGYSIVILSRSPKTDTDKIKYVKWDGKTLGDWSNHLENSEALINLTGKRIDCVFNQKNKDLILNSRVDSVKVLNEALVQCINPPKVWIQASSLAIYDNTKDKICTEESEHGKGFTTEVCKAWENELFDSNNKIRKVVFRIGLAFGEDSPALKPMELLTRFFLGGKHGSGEQYISWIDIKDLNKLFIEAIRNIEFNGAYNACNNSALKNKDFMQTFRKVLGRPYSPPHPEFLIKFGAKFIVRVEPELILDGRKCISKKLKELNFKFNYEDIDKTLSRIYN